MQEGSNGRLARLNAIQPDEPPIEEVIKTIEARKGAYQNVRPWGEYVIKEVFTSLIAPQNATGAEGKKNIVEATKRLERHLEFLHSQFGDLYPRVQAFHAQVDDKHMLFKIQKNLDLVKKPPGNNSLTLGSEFNLLFPLKSDSNPELRRDFVLLYEKWAALREKGLSLDIRFTNNAVLAYDTIKVNEKEKDILRLKIYDSIPMIVLDKDKYAASGLPQDLVVADKNDIDPRNLQEVELFWNFLEDWHDRILPTY